MSGIQVVGIFLMGWALSTAIYEIGKFWMERQERLRRTKDDLHP